jgi:predicted GNAT superfamily acetyltransferase
VAARDELRRGARHRPPVDAVMGVEAAVLVAEQHGQIARIDLAGGGWQPPAAIGQGEGAQQPAVAVDDDRRAKSRRREVERAEAIDVAVPRDRNAEAEDDDERADESKQAAFAAARGPFPPCAGRWRGKRAG